MKSAPANPLFRVIRSARGLSGRLCLLPVVVVLSGCGGGGTTPNPVSPSIPTPVVAPTATTPYPNLVIELGDSPATMDLSTGFSGTVTDWSAHSSDAAVVTVSVTGARAEITPLAVGTVSITVVARNTGGDAERTFTVRVVAPPGPAPPTAAGRLAPLTLALDQDLIRIDLSTAFAPPGFALAVRSLDQDVVEVSAVQGAVAVLKPVGSGSASLQITAQNAAGSVTRWLAVAVVAPPVAVGDLEPLSLVAGTAPTVVDLSAAFDPVAGLTLAGRSEDDAIATAVAAGLELTVTPVAPGTTTVTVTAFNAVGRTNHFVEVSVVPENPVAPLAPAGSITPLILGTGASPTIVDLHNAFTPEGFRLEARSLNSRIARATVSDDSSVAVTAVASGNTEIEITARNAVSTATRYLRVNIVGLPQPKGVLAPLTLAAGAAPAVMEIHDAFTPAGFDVQARSMDEAVATVSVGEGPSVSVTPVAAGSTSIEITASNTSGTATRTVAVEVVNPPVAVGSLSPLSLIVGGESAVVDLEEAFAPSEPLSLRAESEDREVATATVEGRRLRVAPRAAGSTSIIVSARNIGGLASHALRVTVASRAPRAVGTLAAVSMSLTGSAVAVDVGSAFTPAGFAVEASSGNTEIVTVGVSGTVVAITPVGAGSTSVTVTARAAGESATQTFAVTVVSSAPQAVGTISPLRLVARTDVTELGVVDFTSLFTPAGFTLEALSRDTGVVTVTVQGNEVRFRPVAPGSTSVVVTARNGSSSATHTVAVTVVPQAPRAVGTLDPISLSVGDSPAEVDVAGAFSGSELTIAAVTGTSLVATATVDGTLVTVTPVGAGTTTLQVTAENGGGLAIQRTQVTVVVAGAPQVVGALAAVSLTAGGAEVVVDVATAFAGAGITFSARSANPGVVSAEVQGTVVTITPVGAGSTLVFVTATNDNGSATQRIAVTVAAGPPSAVGTLAAVSMSLTGSVVEVDVGSAFTPAGFAVEASSGNTEIVTVGASGTVVAITPVGAGSTSVTVTARAAGESATQTFAVTVVSSAPQAVGTISPLRLVARTDVTELGVVDFTSLFTPAGFTLEALSRDTGVVTVTVQGNEVRFRPVAPGSTSVVVTARNGSSSATHTVAVTVVPQAPRAVGTLDPISLSVGDSPAEVDVAGAFSGSELTIAAVTGTSLVATATVDGTLVTVTPVGAGTTTLQVTAENGGGLAIQRTQVTVVVAGAPQVVGALAAVSLTAGGAEVVVDVATAFAGAGITFSARSANPGVVSAEVQGTVVTITPVGAGSTLVFVTATNDNGSATQRIAVTVAAGPPSAVGTLAAVSMSLTGSVVEVDVGSAFTPAGFAVEASSGNTEIVTVGASGTVVTITPVGAGSTSVTVTARAAGESATQTFAVTVVSSAPQAVGTISPLRLELRPELPSQWVIDSTFYFTPAGFTVEAESQDTGVATVEVRGHQVWISPVAPGSTSVVVTARNGSGSAMHTVSVTVLPPRPQAVGTLGAVSLTAGGSAEQVEVANAFTPAGVPLEAHSGNTGVVTVGVNGTVVTITPVASGSTSVEVTARNESGSATQTIPVTVAPRPPTTVGPPPTTTTLKVGDEPVSFDIMDYFAAEDPQSLTLDVRSENENVVTVEVDEFQSVLYHIVVISPVGVGETNIVVTVSNESGSVSKTFPIVVTAAEGFMVLR